MKTLKQQGFTLIEVMIALVVLSIGLGALLVATTQNIRNYQLLENHMIENWVDIHAMNSLKLGLIKPDMTLPYSSTNTFLGKKCYWKIQLQSTKLEHIYQAKLSSRMTPTGNWEHHAVTFYQLNNKNS